MINQCPTGAPFPAIRTNAHRAQWLEFTSAFQKKKMMAIHFIFKQSPSISSSLSSNNICFQKASSRLMTYFKGHGHLNRIWRRNLNGESRNNFKSRQLECATAVLRTTAHRAQIFFFNSIDFPSLL